MITGFAAIVLVVIMLWLAASVAFAAAWILNLIRIDVVDGD